MKFKTIIIASFVVLLGAALLLPLAMATGTNATSSGMGVQQQACDQTCNNDCDGIPDVLQNRTMVRDQTCLSTDATGSMIRSMDQTCSGIGCGTGNGHVNMEMTRLRQGSN
jgi:hypothetical protein